MRLGHPARVTEGCRHLTLEVKFLSQYDVVRRLQAKVTFSKRDSRSELVREKYLVEKAKLDTQIKNHLEEADVVLGTLLTCGRGEKELVKRS